MIFMQRHVLVNIKSFFFSKSRTRNDFIMDSKFYTTNMSIFRSQIHIKLSAPMVAALQQPIQPNEFFAANIISTINFALWCHWEQTGRFRNNYEAVEKGKTAYSGREQRSWYQLSFVMFVWSKVEQSYAGIYKFQLRYALLNENWKRFKRSLHLT